MARSVAATVFAKVSVTFGVSPALIVSYCTSDFRSFVAALIS
jgi:hypothetical protein